MLVPTITTVIAPKAISLSPTCLALKFLAFASHHADLDIVIFAELIRHAGGDQLFGRSNRTISNLNFSHDASFWISSSRFNFG